MKGFKYAMAALLIAVSSCSVLASCGETEVPPGPGPDPAPTEYTVTFDPDGGTLDGDAKVTVKAGESLTLPAAEKEKSELGGWLLGSVSVGKAGERYTPAASVTLKADWKETDVAPDHGAINRERAISYSKLIHDSYWNSSSKLSFLTPQGGAPYLWPYTEQVSMVNGVLLTMEESDPDFGYYKTYLEELIEGLRHYRVGDVRNARWENEAHTLAKFGETDGTANSYAIYNSGRNDAALDAVSTGMDGVYFDDNIWVAKEYYYAYVNLGDVRYLNEAINIVNWIVGEGYEEATGLHGIYWKWSAKFQFDARHDDNVHASLNSCSSAPTAMMLAKIYTLVNGDDALKAKFGTLAEDYYKKAQNIYEFCYIVLRNPDNGCLRDKIFLKEGFEEMTGDSRIELIDEQILPYNTGTFMTAGAELYAINTVPGKEAFAAIYRERNEQVAADADRHFANTMAVEGQWSYNSNSWFTSFLLEGFIDIESTGVDCSAYIEHMRSSLDYGWENNRNEDGFVSPAWVVGWKAFSDSGISEGNPLQILLQAANAHCYAMLARYYA